MTHPTLSPQSETSPASVSQSQAFPAIRISSRRVKALTVTSTATAGSARSAQTQPDAARLSCYHPTHQAALRHLQAEADALLAQIQGLSQSDGDGQSAASAANQSANQSVNQS
jgi:hypothetical protein